MNAQANQQHEEAIRKLLFTKPEAAKAGSFSVRHLENAINAKALAVVRLGKRCVRIRPEDLQAYINKRRVKAIGEGTAI